jgi:hypothetical protein
MAIGLVLVVVLSIVIPVAAQAEWLSQGSKAEEGAPLGIQIHPFPFTKGEKLFIVLVPSPELKIKCTKGESEEGSLVQPNAILVALKLSACVVNWTGIEFSKCSPIISINALGRLFLHEGEGKKLTYIEWEADEEAAAIIGVDYASNELCPLTDAVIHGRVVTECLSESLLHTYETGQDECLLEHVHHLIAEAPPQLFPKYTLKYGAGNAQVFLDGILDLQLVSGKLWSGHV